MQVLAPHLMQVTGTAGGGMILLTCGLCTTLYHLEKKTHLHTAGFQPSPQTKAIARHMLLSTLRRGMNLRGTTCRENTSEALLFLFVKPTRLFLEHPEIHQSYVEDGRSEDGGIKAGVHFAETYSLHYRIQMLPLLTSYRMMSGSTSEEPQNSGPLGRMLELAQRR